MSKEDAFFAAATGVAVISVGFLGAIYGIASALDHADNKKIDKIEADLSARHTQLVSVIQNSCDLSNFDLASVELSGAQDDYLLKVFGATSADALLGMDYQYKNIYYMLSESSAKAIMSAIEKLDEVKGLKDLNSPERSMVIVGADGINDHTANAKQLKKTKSACDAVYSALEEAVKSAYGHFIEDVGSASQMNSSVAVSCTQLSNLDAAESGLEQKNAAFVSKGIMTTSVSGVVKDEAKNESYFFVDTVQVRKEGDVQVLDSCRAIVTVEGTELSQEEVYAKFIRGEYKKFTEVIREKAGEKVGIANGELTNGVEEIEFL